MILIDKSPKSPPCPISITPFLQLAMTVEHYLRSCLRFGRVADPLLLHYLRLAT